jgi:hypothetical protein
MRRGASRLTLCAPADAVVRASYTSLSPTPTHDSEALATNRSRDPLRGNIVSDALAGTPNRVSVADTAIDGMQERPVSLHRRIGPHGTCTVPRTSAELDPRTRDHLGRASSRHALRQAGIAQRERRPEAVEGPIRSGSQ